MNNKFEKYCYLPIVEYRNGAISDNKYCGTFFLPKDHSHPVCARCAEPMQPLIQLKLSELPELPKNWLDGKGYAIHLQTGILQMYFCVNKKTDCRAEDYGSPFAPSFLVEIIYPKTNDTPKNTLITGIEFPPKVIVGWKKVIDLPLPTEIEHMGEICEEEMEDYYFDGHVEADKLLGWPSWCQDVEFPYCPRCGRQMIFLYQLTNEGFVGSNFLFGGNGQIFVCPIHPIPAFAWSAS